MLKKIENYISVILVAILAILPFIIDFFQGVLRILVKGENLAICHIVFLFACVAGIVTWRDDRHLKLAAFNKKFPFKAKRAIHGICEGAIICLLFTLFFDSLCQLLNPDLFPDKFWFIFTTRFFFAFLPVCYAAMLAMEIYKLCKANKAGAWITVAVGFVISLFISENSIAGIIYYIFRSENLNLLYVIDDAWAAFSHIACFPLIIILIFLGFMGLPLFLVLAGVSYILFSQDISLNVDLIPIETYNILINRDIAAIPLFTIAGYILSQSNAGNRFVKFFNSLFGWFRGGTVVAAVIVTTFFSTFTGVSGITILALGTLLSVVLVGGGYSKDTAESLVTSSGAIGLLFPPSAAIIMYSTTNYFSVDVIDLFKGAIIPGILMALLMIGIGIFFDKQKERSKFSIKEIGTATLNCIPELLMPLFICIFYFRGIFDLFEAAAFSVLYAFVLSTFVRKDFTLKKSCDIIASSVPVSGGVLFILGAASGISQFMIFADIPTVMETFVTQYIHNKFIFLLLMNIFLLLIGCLMDMFSAILIVSPLLLPIAASFDIPAIQAAVIFLMNLSIGFLTPPVGMDLFISSYAFRKPLSKVIKGILPFFVVQLIVLILITYIPFFTMALL